MQRASSLALAFVIVLTPALQIQRDLCLGSPDGNGDQRLSAA